MLSVRMGDPTPRQDCFMASLLLQQGQAPLRSNWFQRGTYTKFRLKVRPGPALGLL
jgi:hypothetical protein